MQTSLGHLSFNRADHCISSTRWSAHGIRITAKTIYSYMGTFLAHNVGREDTSEIHTAQGKEYDTLATRKVCTQDWGYSDVINRRRSYSGKCIVRASAGRKQGIPYPIKSRISPWASPGLALLAEHAKAESLRRSLNKCTAKPEWRSEGVMVTQTGTPEIMQVLNTR